MKQKSPLAMGNRTGRLKKQWSECSRWLSSQDSEQMQEVQKRNLVKTLV